MDIAYIFKLIATPILTALVVWFIERARDKHDALKDEIEQVNREVNNATMELAYATSIAVSEHKCNGELHRAQKAYDNAVEHQKELGQKLINQNK